MIALTKFYCGMVRVLRFLLVALIPAVLLAGGVVLVGDLPAELRGARGDGLAGSLVVTTVDNDRYRSWNGRFTSDDGTVTGRLVGYEDSPPAGTVAGSTIRARYPGGLNAYAPTPGPGEWWRLILHALAVPGGLLLAGLWIRLSWPRSPIPRRTLTTSTPPGHAESR